MATTKVIYNGVILENVLTRTFDQDAVYDSSNTDLMHHDFTIAFVGHVHGVSSTLDPPTYVSLSGFGATHPVELEKLLQRLLLEPRKKFQYFIGDRVLLEALPAPPRGAEDSDGFDVNNGPKPQHVNITQVVGEKILRVEFEIKLSLVMCGSNKNKTGVLSNRWGIEESIDSAHYTRRIVRGRLRLGTANLNPHAFRGWVIPDLPMGFRREEVHVVSTPDGLNLDYFIVDRQIVAAPPWPATDWNCTHAISTNDGLSVVSQIDVWLQGPPEVNRKALIALAVRIMDSKLNVLDKLDNATFQIIDAAIVDHLHENVVEARMAIKHTPESFAEFFGTAGKELGASLEQKKFFKNYKRLVARPPSYYGPNSGTWQLLCYLQSPCDAKHAIPTGRSGESEKKNEKTKELSYPPRTTTSESEDLPDYKTPHSPSHRTAMYTNYEVVSRYLVNKLRVALPIAGEPKREGSSSQNSDNKKASAAPSVAVIALSARGIAKRIIRITAERVGHWPAIPAPADYQDAGGKASLLNYWIEPSAPKKTVDGRKKIYRVEAEYIYVLAREPSTKEALRTGSLPWDLTNLKENALPAAALIAPNQSDAIA